MILHSERPKLHQVLAKTVDSDLLLQTVALDKGLLKCLYLMQKL